VCVCVCVCVVQVNNAEWQLGDALCDMWVALDVMCCTASILHLMAISIDRSRSHTSASNNSSNFGRVIATRDLSGLNYPTSRVSAT